MDVKKLFYKDKIKYYSYSVFTLILLIGTFTMGGTWGPGFGFFVSIVPSLLSGFVFYYLLKIISYFIWKDDIDNFPKPTTFDFILFYGIIFFTLVTFVPIFYFYLMNK